MTARSIPVTAPSADRPHPITSPVQAYLEEIHAAFAGVRDGEVATYIPELAKADPAWFGICVATTDGHTYEVGHTRQRFTIQSISKPFVYGLALADRGAAAVRSKIGVEPTGDAFNSISLSPATGCPLNPMINAGAIASTSLVAGHSQEDRLERILAQLSLYAGRRLDIDDAVYQSERDTGHRNRAIAHMLRNFDIMGDHPELALDLYFRQCSVLVDCRDLSLMAATLANGGVNPVTGEQAVGHDDVERILSVMTSCGMYDSAGEWIYSVGMPAKSGVAGGVLAVLPGQLGIAVFSPRLDPHGNSVRGVGVCQRLSEDLNLHFLRSTRSARATIRSQSTLATLSSRRVRNERERTLLTGAGHRARVYELQGDLPFAGIETIVRAVANAAPAIDYAIVDLKRVTRVEDCAVDTVLRLAATLDAAGKRLVLASAAKQARFVRGLEEGAARLEPKVKVRIFPDLDRALEWCEDRLIGEAAGDGADIRPMALADHRICRGFTPPAVALLDEALERLSFAPGASIVRRGDPGDHVYLLMAGRVSVTLEHPDGRVERLSTFAPGTVFGEAAFLDRSPRTANVHAETAVECLALSAAAYARLGEAHPTIKIALLENLLRNLYDTLARQTSR